MPDSPTPPEIDLIAPWTWHAIAAHAVCKGADGVDIREQGGNLYITSACEQGAKVVRAVAPLCSTVFTVMSLPGSFSGPEDSVFGDVDGDGDALDIVTSETGAKRLRWFKHNAGTDTYSAGVQIASGQFYIRARVSAPGEVISGSYSTGSTIQRHTLSAGVWTSTVLSTVGWTKELQVTATEILVWDKEGPLKGLRGIDLVTGAAGTRYTTDLYTMGGVQNGLGQLTGTGDTAGSSIRLSGTNLAYPSNFGWYRSGDIGDIDGDGFDDVVVTSSHAGDAATVSSAVWLKGPTWARGEISGPVGIKHDNVLLYDVDCDSHKDALTTEEFSLGSGWFENPL